MTLLRFFQTAVLVVTIAGCGQGTDPWKAKRPATVPARGVVTYRGNPLEKAMVILQPVDTTGVAASAITNAKGEFELRSYPPDSGTIPGSYAVCIIKTDADDPKYDVMPVYNDDPEYMKEAAAPMPVSLIPARYNDPSQSGIKVTITSEGNTSLLFELAD